MLWQIYIFVGDWTKFVLKKLFFVYILREFGLNFRLKKVPVALAFFNMYLPCLRLVAEKGIRRKCGADVRKDVCSCFLPVGVWMILVMLMVVSGCVHG